MIVGIAGIIVGIIGIIVGIAGLVLSVRQWQKRQSERREMFLFLRGVKTSAEGNVNNTGDTSAVWKALLRQIDDINKRLEKK